ncbi:hypothetical protein MNB_SV-14-1082 [hydrothermal vent metagenome]|uniref:Uncharacterized protein n=1 Tax=hydrothermal vent metagenome TaxID=652676 RepID=A0A1W1CNE7_9ZZZZ
MSINLIKKSLLPLFVATLLLWGFFWQFSTIYPFLIENFSNTKLSVLYAHLIIYTFVVLIFFTSFANLVNHFILKSKLFITITLLVSLVFYTLLNSVINDLFRYFINLPLSENMLMGLVLFIVTSIGYALYSLALLLFNRFIPLSHIVIFTLLGLGYSAFFINSLCYPVSEFFSKF